MAYELATSTHWKYDRTENTPFLNGVERIINAGFKNLDFNFLDMVNPNCKFLSDTYEDWIFECKEFVESRGAKWVQAHAVAPEVFGYHDGTKKHIKRSIECCSLLGIKWIVMHHTGLPSVWGSSLSGHEFNMKYFSEFLNEAEKYGVGIAIENNTSFPFYTGSKYGDATEELIKLVDSLGGNHIGVCWDVGHAHISAAYDEAEHIANQSEQLKIIGNRLKATHIHDNNIKKHSIPKRKVCDYADGGKWLAFDEHLQPYQGDVDWDDVIKGLDAINYENYFTYETHTAVNNYPDELADDQMRFLYKLGNYIISKSEL